MEVMMYVGLASAAVYLILTIVEKMLKKRGFYDKKKSQNPPGGDQS